MIETKKFFLNIRLILRPMKHWIVLNLVWPFMKSQIPNFKIMNSQETLKFIYEKKCSMVRFGDGELDIIFGRQGPKFQKNQPELQCKLKKVLNHSRNDLLVCLPESFNPATLSYCNGKTEYFWKYYLLINLQNIRKTINVSPIYGSSQVTRPYLRLLDKSSAKEIFDKFKLLFSSRDIVIIEGEKTRFGVGNDLLDGAISVKRILGPAVNAFDQSGRILAECVKQPKSSLFLVSLGPAAKSIVDELTSKGYQAIDVGHLDLEYEHFLRSADKLITIPGKWTNEAENTFQEWDKDISKYKSEIIFQALPTDLNY